MTRCTIAGLVATCMAVLLAPVIAASPTMAGAEAAEVVFRVTLEGPVPSTHGFAIRCHAENPCFGPETISPVCGPPNEAFQRPLCEPGTFEVVGVVPPDETIEYVLLRWTSPNLTHTADQPEEHLAGSWTVRPGRQVISLGFDYSAAGAETPGLPDTAMSALRGVGPEARQSRRTSTVGERSRALMLE